MTETDPAISLTPTTPPLVSVIVLAWRLDAELTACVRALAAQQGAPAFEVVVVENGATPEVRAAVDSLNGVVRVSLPANRGFGAGCAAGALAATGSALVFLNDDAIPRPDWLAALARRATADDAPVAVGSLLLDTDGRVQEAGSRLLPGAGTKQWGKGLSLADAEARGLLRPRPVDYCSAAAVWIDRGAFDTVGGFDEVFTPAYYEDVDLQLRLRLTGRDVVVEPSAMVVHRSGGSTDSMPLYREFLGHRNGSIFAARWADTLALAHTADDPIELVGEVRPPDLGATLDSSHGVPHEAVAGDYAVWLSSRLVTAEHELHELHERFAALQHDHHEALQLMDSMKNHIEHLESMGTAQLIRERLSSRHHRSAAD